VLVIADGGVVEAGTHDELLIRKGAYYRLYQTQFAKGSANGQSLAV